jgi:dephospho-CoA kinase
MRLVGLTGNIAVGKSTVAQWFRDKGVPIVDADDVAKSVVAIGSAGLADIVNRFGAVLNADGSLDRKRLGSVVFGDEKARAELNAIVHPLVRAESAQRLVALAQQEHPLAVYDAALLFENGLAGQFDDIIVVICDEATQLQRLMVRNSLTEREATQRMEAQMPQHEKMRLADFVIDNSHHRDETYRQCQHVYEAIAAKTKQVVHT